MAGTVSWWMGERLRKLMQELQQAGTVIIFIDNCHNHRCRCGRRSHRCLQYTQPALAKGELQAIGATTIDEYRKYIERDPALEGVFSPSWLESPHGRSYGIKRRRDRYETSPR